MIDERGCIMLGAEEDFVVDAFNKLVVLLSNKELLCNKDIEESQVVQWLDKFLADSVFEKNIKIGEKFYRARCVNSTNYTNKQMGFEITGENISGFNESESREPPMFKVSDARCNIMGMSYLYLASNIYTACCEVRPLLKEMISVATFIISMPLKVFNLGGVTVGDNDSKPKKLSELGDISMRETFLYYLVYTFEREFRPSKDKYNVAQFLADRIRKFGYDGLVYPSSMGDGENYVIFNSHKNNVKWDGSQIFLCTKKTFEFYSLNRQERVDGSSDFIEPSDVKNYKANFIRDVSESRKK